MSKRIFVLSDLHMTVPGRLNTFHAGEALADFVSSIVDPDHTLVLAGDTFDFLHLDNRPRTLHLTQTPALAKQMFDGIKSTEWGTRLFEALGALVQAGGQLVVLPGNHDPEFLVPDLEPVLREALGLTDEEGLLVYRTPGAWIDQVGEWEVVVGHGHRIDMWNDVDPAAIQRALDENKEEVAFPPGSLLVLDTVNKLNLETDPVTGRQSFPFTNALKPEVPAVLLLLFYLAPKLAREHLGSVGRQGWGTMIRSLRNTIRRGPVFVDGDEQELPGLPGDDALVGEAMARALYESLDEDAHANLEDILDEFESFAETEAEAEPLSFADHGGLRRYFLRAWLIRLSKDQSFFDPTHASKHDQEIIDRELMKEGDQPRVVISGHTHAAREIRPDNRDDRVYLNTGTWTDLMPMRVMDDHDAVSRWIDDVAEARVERQKLLYYAEVTEEGPSLKRWGAQ